MELALMPRERKKKGRCLTRCERVILLHILRGDSNLTIASSLGCAVKTVEFHVTNILKKSGEKSRLGLVLRACGPHPVGGIGLSHEELAIRSSPPPSPGSVSPALTSGDRVSSEESRISAPTPSRASTKPELISSFVPSAKRARA
jgi:DNA-binding CsgD family transcriptional regulator